jgi:hypothetical protein
MLKYLISEVVPLNVTMICPAPHHEGGFSDMLRSYGASSSCAPEGGGTRLPPVLTDEMLNIHAMNIIHYLTNCDLEVLTREQAGKMFALCYSGLPRRRCLDLWYCRHLQRHIWLRRMASIRSGSGKIVQNGHHTSSVTCQNPAHRRHCRPDDKR